MAHPSFLDGAARRDAHAGSPGIRRSRAIVLIAIWLVGLSGCGTPRDDPGLPHPPLDDQDVTEVREEETEEGQAEGLVEGFLQPRFLDARLWSGGPHSLAARTPIGLRGEYSSVPLLDSRLASTRDPRGPSFAGLLEGARDGAFRALFQEGFCAGSFRPECSADYGRALRRGVFSGAFMGLLGGLIGGDRSPPHNRVPPGER